MVLSQVLRGGLILSTEHAAWSVQLSGAKLSGGELSGGELSGGELSVTGIRRPAPEIEAPVARVRHGLPVVITAGIRTQDAELLNPVPKPVKLPSKIFEKLQNLWLSNYYCNIWRVEQTRVDQPPIITSRTYWKSAVSLQVE